MSVFDVLRALAQAFIVLSCAFAGYVALRAVLPARRNFRRLGVLLLLGALSVLLFSFTNSPPRAFVLGVQNTLLVLAMLFGGEGVLLLTGAWVLFVRFYGASSPSVTEILLLASTTMLLQALRYRYLPYDDEPESYHDFRTAFRPALVLVTVATLIVSTLPENTAWYTSLLAGVGQAAAVSAFAYLFWSQREMASPVSEASAVAAGDLLAALLRASPDSAYVQSSPAADLHRLRPQGSLGAHPPFPEALRGLQRTLANEALTQRQLTRKIVSTESAKGHLHEVELRVMPLRGTRVLTLVRDTCGAQCLEDVLRFRQGPLESIALALDSAIGIVEPSGEVSHAYRNGPNGRKPARLPSHAKWPRYLTAAGLRELEEALNQVRSGQAKLARVSVEVKYCLARMWLEVQLAPVLVNGQPTGQVCFIAKNTTVRHTLESRALLAEVAIQSMTDGVVVTRATDDKVVWFNKGFLTLSGRTESETIGASADLLLNSFPLKGAEGKLDALQATGNWSGELLSQRKDGSWFPEWRQVSLFEYPDTGELLYVNLIHDLSQERSHQETIYSLKHKDTLTNLPNRGHFLSMVKRRLEQLSPRQEPLAVLVLDLCKFNAINRSLGRDAGDAVLREVAARLRQRAGALAVPARIEADTFATYLEGDLPSLALSQRASNLLLPFDSPILVQGQEVYVRGHVGIARYPMDGNTAEALLNKASLAAEESVSEMDNSVRFYNNESGESGLRRLSLEMALRKTLLADANELYLEYQPKIACSGGEVVGFEALCRWTSASLGGVSPAEFIPVAEESGLIHFLGGWVFEEACRQLGEWQSQGLAVKPVAVNLSVRQMHDDKLPARLLEVTKKYKVDPALLELEITESDVMDDLALAAEVLKRLRNKGFSIALDDFGTGYSSMAYIQRLPLDTLKFDRSFVQGLGENKESDSIVTALIALAKSLTFQTVAEGVEHVRQLDFLKSAGCTAYQGYIFSPAVPAAQATSYLAPKPVLHLKQLESFEE